MFGEPVKKNDKQHQHTNNEIVPAFPGLKDWYVFLIVHFCIAYDFTVWRELFSRTNASCQQPEYKADNKAYPDILQQKTDP
jgi:hypothetical protein